MFQCKNLTTPPLLVNAPGYLLESWFVQTWIYNTRGSFHKSKRFSCKLVSLKIFRDFIILCLSSSQPLLHYQTPGDHDLTNLNLYYRTMLQANTCTCTCYGFSCQLKDFISFFSLYSYVQIHPPPPQIVTLTYLRWLWCEETWIHITGRCWLFWPICSWEDFKRFLFSFE